MKLFYSPGACSIGIHILLEEIGEPFETERVQTKTGGTRTPEYLALNPKGKVPLLILDDGSPLTEFPAIAFYLAWRYPEAELLTGKAETDVRVLEAFEYLVSTVHMRGLHRMYGPARIAPGADVEAVREEGCRIVTEGLGYFEERLGRHDQDYLFGRFGIADVALFYVELNAFRLQMSLPSRIMRHLRAMLDRPSVLRAMQREGVMDWVSSLGVETAPVCDLDRPAQRTSRLSMANGNSVIIEGGCDDGEAAETFPLDSSVSLMMRDVHRMFNKSLEKRLSAYGITGATWYYLSLLGDRHSTRQTELMEALGISGATAVQVLQELEEKGLIRRTRDQNDKRKMTIRLTAQGCALRQKLLGVAMEVQDLAMSEVSPEEEIVFRSTIRRMQAALLRDQQTANSNAASPVGTSELSA